jgi:hypothetical protein
MKVIQNIQRDKKMSWPFNRDLSRVSVGRLSHGLQMRMPATEDCVGRMSALFRVLLNPRQIFFDSRINTGTALGTACANKKRMCFID